MKIFKVYKWDCIISWILFGLLAILFCLYEGFEVIDCPILVSGSSLVYYLFLIPVHLILWLISVIFSIKDKQLPAIIFCFISPIVSVAFTFFIIIIHVYITGGV